MIESEKQLITYLKKWESNNYIDSPVFVNQLDKFLAFKDGGSKLKDSLNTMRFLSLSYSVHGGLLCLEGNANLASKFLSKSLDMYVTFIKHHSKNMLAEDGSFTESTSNLFFNYYLSLLLGHSLHEEFLSSIVNAISIKGEIEPIPHDSDYCALLIHLCSQLSEPKNHLFSEGVYSRFLADPGEVSLIDCWNYRTNLAKFVSSHDTFSIFHSLAIWALPVEIAVLVKNLGYSLDASTIASRLEPLLKLSYDDDYENADLVRDIASQSESQRSELAISSSRSFFDFFKR